MFTLNNALPCPFCNSKNVTNGAVGSPLPLELNWVVCEDCEATGPVTSHKDYIDLWNKRTNNMKGRADTARFIESQLNSDYECKRDKVGHYSYGWQDLRELMDFIYEGEPESVEEELTNDCEYRKRIKN